MVSAVPFSFALRKAIHRFVADLALKAQPLVHSLEVRRHKVGISSGYLKRAMTENLLEVEHATAARPSAHR
jgi:hypothetical protein